MVPLNVIKFRCRCILMGRGLPSNGIVGNEVIIIPCIRLVAIFLASVQMGISCLTARDLT